jgi:hypothetical protein
MALSGLQPFSGAGLLDAQPAGHQGRDPLQWGPPQDQSAGQPAPPAADPVFVPGAEYGDHGSFGIATDHIPGAGEIVGVPVTGYLGPADPRWQEYQRNIRHVHGESTHDAPWHTTGRNIDDGHPLPAVRRLQVTDTTDQHAPNGTIVPSRDIWRSVELIVHNAAKLLNGPWIAYSERPFYNNVAIVAPQSDPTPDADIPGTGRTIGSPSNRYKGAGIAAIQDPGVAVAYMPPAEPATVPDTSTSPDVPSGLEWMTYG